MNVVLNSNIDSSNLESKDTNSLESYIDQVINIYQNIFEGSGINAIDFENIKIHGNRLTEMQLALQLTTFLSEIIGATAVDVFVEFYIKANGGNKNFYKGKKMKSSLKESLEQYKNFFLLHLNELLNLGTGTTRIDLRNLEHFATTISEVIKNTEYSVAGLLEYQGTNSDIENQYEGEDSEKREDRGETQTSQNVSGKGKVEDLGVSQESEKEEPTEDGIIQEEIFELAKQEEFGKVFIKRLTYFLQNIGKEIFTQNLRDDLGETGNDRNIYQKIAVQFKKSLRELTEKTSYTFSINKKYGKKAGYIFTVEKKIIDTTDSEASDQKENKEISQTEIDARVKDLLNFMIASEGEIFTSQDLYEEFFVEDNLITQLIGKAKELIEDPDYELIEIEGTNTYSYRKIEKDLPITPKKGEKEELPISGTEEGKEVKDSDQDQTPVENGSVEQEEEIDIEEILEVAKESKYSAVFQKRLRYFLERRGEECSLQSIRDDLGETGKNAVISNKLTFQFKRLLEKFSKEVEFIFEIKKIRGADRGYMFTIERKIEESLNSNEEAKVLEKLEESEDLQGEGKKKNEIFPNIEEEPLVVVSLKKEQEDGVKENISQTEIDAKAKDLLNLMEENEGIMYSKRDLCNQLGVEDTLVTMLISRAKEFIEDDKYSIEKVSGKKVYSYREKGKTYMASAGKTENQVKEEKKVQKGTDFSRYEQTFRMQVTEYTFDVTGDEDLLQIDEILSDVEKTLFFLLLKNSGKIYSIQKVYDELIGDNFFVRDQESFLVFFNQVKAAINKALNQLSLQKFQIVKHKNGVRIENQEKKDESEKKAFIFYHKKIPITIEIDIKDNIIIYGDKDYIDNVGLIQYIQRLYKKDNNKLELTLDKNDGDGIQKFLLNSKLPFSLLKKRNTQDRYHFSLGQQTSLQNPRKGDEKKKQQNAEINTPKGNNKRDEILNEKALELLIYVEEANIRSMTMHQILTKLDMKRNMNDLPELMEKVGNILKNDNEGNVLEKFQGSYLFGTNVENQEERKKIRNN